MGDDGLFADFDSLFGESRVNHGGPGAGPVVWQSEGSGPITLEVSPQSSTGLMAHFVWQSSMTLAELLAARRLAPLVDVSPDSVVVELGSGAALPSLVCDLVLGAKCVLATDYPDDNVLEAMRRNAAHNKCSDRLRVLGLDWEAEDGASKVQLAASGSEVDYILAADCLWMPQYHGALLKTVLSLMRTPRTLLVMAFMHHDFDGTVASKFTSALVGSGEVELVAHTQHNWRKDKAHLPGKEEYGDVQVMVFRKRR
ncbi:hypothetical protein BASA81_006912 [Batrachochytrium salamandrivorans]|nr:hypothetical protein BASA81_006912 [Batrachochytrium salamandrivorans]